MWIRLLKKTKPMCRRKASANRQQAPGRGQIVRNKPNLATWPGVRNKPNFHGRDIPPFQYSIIPSVPLADRGLLVQTKPICLRWAEKTIPEAFGLEAATLGGGQVRKTKPIYADPHRNRVPCNENAERVGRDAQPSIRSRAGSTKSHPPGGGCTNKANWRAGARRSRHPTIPVFHHSNDPLRLPGPLYKQSQFAGLAVGREEDKCLRRKRL